MIEDEAAKGKGSVITLYASQEAAIYVLNTKRADLAEIEMRYGVNVEVIPEGENEGAKMRVASRGPKPEFVPRFEPIVEPEDDVIEDTYDEEEDSSRNAASARKAAKAAARATAMAVASAASVVVAATATVATKTATAKPVTRRHRRCRRS
jgi:ribonuclease E